MADNPTSIADNLAYVFTNDPNSPVIASASGGTLSLTSKMSGLQANYPISVSISYDTSDFSRPSFTSTTSGQTMTGATDGLPNGATPSLSTPLVTQSNYDPLGDLTSVSQGQQQRLFVYDGMGRLTSATTPESGTAQYTYTTFSQVNTRTDARNITSTYSYDGINRLSGITYSDSTSPVSFTYDQGGSQSNASDRLTSMTDGVGSETYQYDVLGRETAMTKTISGIAYPLAYSYNTASELKQITYPSGRTVAQTVDALGRPTEVTSGSTNYISGVNYNAAAQPTSYQYGNGVQAAFSYNAQMQLQSLSYSNSSGTIVGLTYGYGTGDNGQIQSVTDSADAGRTANFTYDAWARLKTAQTTGDTAYPAWGLSFTYDRYGNRTAQSVTTGSAPANSLSFSTTGGALTNHADTFSYDASGNMLNDGTNTLTYDAENRVLTSAGSLGSATYTYDGNGLRVEKSGSNGSTIYIFSGAKVIGEYAPGAQPSSPTTEYIYAGASLVASIAGATPTYYHPDQLSARALTSSTGSVVAQRGDYPFGESWYATGTNTKWQFTSYERDPESANDYAMARYDVNRLGRFSSPDSLSGAIAAPQTLNHYSYALNDPINLIDPSGMSPNCLIDSQGNCIGGSGGSCTVDGQSVDCGTAMNLLQMGGAAQCPGNDCGPIAGANGWLYQIILTNDDGFEYVNPLSGNLFNSDGSELPLLGDPDGNFSFDGAMQSPAQNAGCTQPILNAVNKQFGTSFTANNVQGDPFPNGGGTNLIIVGAGLSAAQFNSIQTGRYPLSPLTWLIGYGPTLHITGPTFFDPPPATFQNSNVGGATSVTFTAHIDTSFAYNPIGALIHLFRDLLHIGGPRKPC